MMNSITLILLCSSLLVATGESDSKNEAFDRFLEAFNKAAETTGKNIRTFSDMKYSLLAEIDGIKLSNFGSLKRLEGQNVTFKKVDEHTEVEAKINLEGFLHVDSIQAVGHILNLKDLEIKSWKTEFLFKMRYARNSAGRCVSQLASDSQIVDMEFIKEKSSPQNGISAVADTALWLYLNWFWRHAMGVANAFVPNGIEEILGSMDVCLMFE